MKKVNYRLSFSPSGLPVMLVRVGTEGLWLGGWARDVRSCLLLMTVKYISWVCGSIVGLS